MSHLVYDGEIVFLHIFGFTRTSGAYSSLVLAPAEGLYRPSVCTEKALISPKIIPSVPSTTPSTKFLFLPTPLAEHGSSDGHFLLLFSSLFPHLQICQRPLTKTWFQWPLTIETENAMGGGGGCGSLAVYAILFYFYLWSLWNVGLQIDFLPTPLAIVWVFRLTFYPSPPSPPPSHL